MISRNFGDTNNASKLTSIPSSSLLEKGLTDEDIGNLDEVGIDDLEQNVDLNDLDLGLTA